MTKNLVTDTNRNVEELKKPFNNKVKMFLSDERIKDKIFITEGVRSKQRQNYLYSLGRTRPGQEVTWTLNSKHIDGLAFDIAFTGKELYPSDFNEWREVANIAKEYGIDWGYDLWQSDKPHFQNNPNIKYMPNEKKETKNKFKDLLEEKKIKNSYQGIFEDLKSDDQLNEAEVKTLIEIGFANIIERMLKK